MRIIIIDDHALFLQGITTLLEHNMTDAKIFPFQHLSDAFQFIKQNKDIDLLLADIYMPKYNGQTISELLSEKEIFIPILLVSATDDLLLIKKYLDNNAAGFVHKSSEPLELIAAINSVIKNGFYMSDTIAKKINQLPEIILSKRQSEVLEQLSKGLTNRQIGESLGISEVTIKTHVSALFDYFNASNRLDCIRKAEKLGMVSSNNEFE